jgi:Protein of unknown function (DUF3072)
MTPTPNPADLTATAKQLAYLRTLAQRAGQKFTTPRTREQASAEIRRLKQVRSSGLTFAELQAEHAAREARDDAPADVHGFEVSGWGADCTWSQRS